MQAALFVLEISVLNGTFQSHILNAHNYTAPFVNQVTYGYGNFSTEATKGVQVNKSRTLKSIKNNKILLFDRLYSHGVQGKHKHS